MLSNWRCSALVAGLLCVTSLAHADPAVQEWIKTYPWPPYTYGAMIALDPDDNVISVGHDPGASDIVTTKYDPAGNILWERHYTMEDYSLRATWVATDGDGNVIVTGYPQTFSSNPVQTGLLTIKYDSDGALLWDDLYSGTWAFAVRAVTDGVGNIFVTGRAWFGTYDFVTIKYAPDGSRAWLDVFDQGGGNHTPTSMDLDPSGNLLVAGGGLSGGMITTLYDASGQRQWVVERPGGAGSSVRWTNDGHFYLTGSWYTQSTSNDFRLLKYDAAGALTWERFYDFGASEIGTKLALDTQENVYVTGYQSGGGYANWLTIRVDPDGNLLWSRLQDSHPAYDEFPNFLVTGPQNEVYITGSGGPSPVPGQSYIQMLTLRYDADGTTAWVGKHYAWASRGVGVALASDNNVYAVGLGNSITTIKYAQSPVDVPAPTSDGVGRVTLLASEPNPFRSDVALRYSLSGTTRVRLAIFDVSGRLVANLVDGVRGHGEHRVFWDGRDARGIATPPGVYVMRLSGGSGEVSRKIVRMR
ncbi:MAG: T9SS type A sorting domain-containing protein [bacterium]